MTDTELMRRVAIVQARVACAQIRMGGMKAANVEQKQRGFALAYPEEAFEKLLEEEGVHSNAVILMLND